MASAAPPARHAWTPQGRATSDTVAFGFQAAPRAVVSAPLDLPVDRMLPWPMGRPVVLAVDDDPDVLRLLAFVFAEEMPDAELRAVGTAREAECAALAWQPALILCDIRLPDEDGRHLLARLRARPNLARVPSVLMTGLDSADGALREDAAALNAALLRKPFDLVELLRLVGRALSA
jgi:CheY-like chemotaxis protein